MFESECQEDEDVTTDKTTREDEENFDCALNNEMCFEQTPLMSENSDDDRLQDTTTKRVESNSEEPIIHTEDEDVPCACYGKDDEVEEVNPDSIDYSSYSGNNHLSPEEIKKNEVEEAEEEYVDHQEYAPQAEIWSSSSEQETNRPSTQQEQCDHVTDKVMPPIWDTDCDEDGGLAGEEVIVEDHLTELTAVRFDAHSPQFDKQDVEIEQKEENGLTCGQDADVLDDDQVKEKMLTTDNTVACSEECDSSSMAPSPALPCLSAPVKVDNHDDSLSGITTDAKAQISGMADVLDLSLDRQHQQEENKMVPSLDEYTDSASLGIQMPSNETENYPEININGTTVVLSEECNDQVYDPQVQSCFEGQQSVQTIRNEAFDKASAVVAPDIFACDGENVTIPITAEVFDKASVAAVLDTVANVPSVIVEEVSCPHLPSICQDHMEDNESFNETGFDSVTDADACNNPSLTALLTSEEVSLLDMSFSQDQQSDQTRNKEDFSEVINGTASVMTEDMIATMCQMHLPSFEQRELRDNDISAGVGEESGISSMTVSPDAGNEFDVIFEDMVLPAMDCDQQSEEQTGAQNSLFADDVAISVIKEDTAGMVFGPYPSSHSQPTLSAHTGWTNYESFAANEDMFGHEVEESYHRAMDQFAAQIAESVTSFTEELKKQTDVKVVVDVVEVKEKTARVSVEKKEETKAEEKEEDYEKTEISIMEATMDHNEWIMDSTYQALPWMNLSATSFAQDQTQTNQPPTEERQCSSTVADTTCTDTTDIQPSTEVRQTSTLFLVDESTENNKKVVAVQPMPQNVNVTFRVHYFTQSPYQTVAVTGNQEELGNWKGFVPLERSKDGHWATVVSLPTESIVEWKFVVVDKGEVCRWEECGNRLLDTGFGDDLLVHKWWGRL